MNPQRNLNDSDIENAGHPGYVSPSANAAPKRSDKTSVTNNVNVSKETSKKSSSVSVDKQRKDEAQHVKASDSKNTSKINKNDRKSDSNNEPSISPGRALPSSDRADSSIYSSVR